MVGDWGASRDRNDRNRREKGRSNRPEKLLLRFLGCILANVTGCELFQWSLGAHLSPAGMWCSAGRGVILGWKIQTQLTDTGEVKWKQLWIILSSVHPVPELCRGSLKDMDHCTKPLNEEKQWAQRNDSSCFKPAWCENAEGQIDRQVDGTAREAVGVRFYRTVAKSGSQRPANRERSSVCRQVWKNPANKTNRIAFPSGSAPQSDRIDFRLHPVWWNNAASVRMLDETSFP